MIRNRRGHSERVDAVRREVLEESGLHFEPRQISLIESNGPFWLSITFWGEIVGGSLKTVPDAESLGARWFPLEQIREFERSWIGLYHRRQFIPSHGANLHSGFCLRAPIVHMIDASLRCRSCNVFLRDFLPSKPTLDIQCILYRLAIVWLSKPTDLPSHLLVRKSDPSRLPTFRLNGGTQLEVITTFLQFIFSPDVTFCSNLGHFFNEQHIRVFEVNFNPRSDSVSALNAADGLRLSLRVILRANQEVLPSTLPDFDWCSLSSEQTTVDTSQMPPVVDDNALLRHLISLPANDPSLPAFLF
ncbi:unnamed protein product [Dicrocoelium dendriticum]|nr:unnamed protein product [Dicrocoelium dendriticum]